MFQTCSCIGLLGTTFERAKVSCRIAPNTLSLIVFDTLRAIIDELGTECIKVGLKGRIKSEVVSYISN